MEGSRDTEDEVKRRNDELERTRRWATDGAARDRPRRWVCRARKKSHVSEHTSSDACESNVTVNEADVVVFTS